MAVAYNFTIMQFEVNHKFITWFLNKQYNVDKLQNMMTAVDLISVLHVTVMKAICLEYR